MVSCDPKGFDTVSDFCCKRKRMLRLPGDPVISRPYSSDVIGKTTFQYGMIRTERICESATF